MKLYAVAIALSLAGCTGGTGGCPTESGEPYSISTGSAGGAEGFALGCREVIEIPDPSDDEDCPECDEARARIDFEIKYHGVVNMGIGAWTDTQPFCLKGEDFDSVEDIPSDISDCDWGWAYLGVADFSSEKLQLGYIVRDRAQRRFWRLRVVELNSYVDDSPYRFEAVFEVAEFGE